MTLYDSKGLEFDDVLLYNFFGDSAIDASRWQVVLNGVQGQGYVPDFYRDETRYAGICSELKLLYVGITRAKKNVWIFDTSDKSDAMRIFWKSQNLIRTCARGTDIPPLAVSSTPEEWTSSGRSLFLHKRYSQAIHCFKRAGLRREVKVCEAYLLRDAARSNVGVALLNIQQRAFITAAEAFADCGAAATGNERRQYYRTSADCYVRGGQDLTAADTYLKAEEFELAAKIYRKAGAFDRTLHVLTDHCPMIPEKTAADLWMVCRLHYCGGSNDQAPMPLFSSFDEELEFLEEYDLDCIPLLESRSMYYKVAEIHLSENRPMEAVQAFLKDNGNIDSVARAADTLLEFMWRKCSFRITPKAAVDHSVRQAIALADKLQVKKLEPMTRNLVSMFQSILRKDHKSLKTLALTFQEHGHHTVALHCLDHFFTRSIDIRPFQLHEMASFLETFYTYARLLHQTSTLPDPLGRRECDVQRLFSIVPLSGDEFLIPSGTFLYVSVATTQNYHLVSMHQSGYMASRRNVTELIYLSIRTVLNDKVLALEKMCCGAPVFLQCLPYIVYGNCERKGCSQEHVTMSNLDRVQYNAHVAIHVQLILILQLLYSAHPSMMRWTSMRNWLERLHEALTPPLFIQGSFVDLDLTLIPHGLAGLRVVKNWIRESFYRLDTSKNPQFLTTLMRITGLSFAFDRNNAPSYIAKAPFLTRNISTELLRKLDNRYLVRDMLNSYRGATSSSISSGIMFVLYVLDNRLYVDLSVLCDCIEDILSSFVVNHRMDPTLDELPLHGVVLSSNWLISPHKFSVKKDVEPESISSLLDAIGNLINTLLIDGATGFLQLAHVTSITPLLRNIFIFRLCRTLCLVAHNTRYPMVKRKVNSIVLHLHKTKTPQHPEYYRKLVDDVVEDMALLPDRGIPRLDGYLRAVLDFNSNNTPSDLVKLVHKTRKSSQASSVRQLFYERASEIPYLLSSRMVAAQSVLRAEAATFVPRMPCLKDDIEIRPVKENLEPMRLGAGGEKVEEKGVPVVIDAEAIDGMEDMDEAVTSLTSLDPVPDESLRSNWLSEEQDWAARRIQYAYRFHVWRRSGSAADAEIDAIFRRCLKETQSSEWRPSYYRLLFLGPLPYLLACLEHGITLTYAAKAKTKDLSKVSHEKLEELGRQRSEIVALIKKGSKLRSKLEPSSPDHRNRDIDALKRAVLEVGEFIQKVPGSTKDMQTKFEMAFKGIVAEKKLFRVHKKPALNVEDL
jgi:tetratricopeptide (TPR) repeat protein